MPTKQETFDTVVDHLRKQERQCVNDFGDCLYRGPNGMKCAAGVLIPDELYDPSMEDACVVPGGLLPVSQVISNLGHDLALVSDLQEAHDRQDTGGWESDFALIALDHGLTYTPPAKE